MDLIGFTFVVIFYLAILFGGIWIARRKGVLDSESLEQLVLANRDLGLGVGIFTLIATEVGGAFVNGTAEEVYKSGLLWCLAPIGYALSMTINGIFFVPKLREKNYITLIDSLQNAFGETMGGIVYLPSCIGDVCWTAAVLSALGTTLSVILDIDIKVSVVLSAAVAVLYTLVGGMFSVAYTDVIQIVFIFGGLWLAIPFMWTAQGNNLNNLSPSDWTGTVQGKNWFLYIDTILLIICGGIPWQPYYQRALAVRTIKQAQILSIFATIGCFLFMIPPVLIGGIAKATNLTDYGSYNVSDNPSIVLPVSLAALVPYWVSIFGLSAISAAAMSSVDSSLLSGASYLTHNVYSGIFKKFETSKKENVIVFRISVLFLGVSSTILSLSTNTIYGLWVLAGDLGYVIVFPQFFASVYFPDHLTLAGSISAAVLSVILRLLIGEEMIGLPAIIPTENFLLPLKTLLMLLSMLTLYSVSKLTSRTLKPQSELE